MSARLELAPLAIRDARTWRSAARGPCELFLACEGGIAARLATAIHQRWPFPRGAGSLLRVLSSAAGPGSVPFRSGCGVSLRLPLSSPDFVRLLGRHPMEPMEMAILARVVRAGDIFVDVGAHRGLYVPHVLGRLRPGGRYHAIEPSPANARFLGETFTDTDFELHELAASDARREAFLANDPTMQAHVVDGAETGTIPIRTERLDRLFADPQGAGAWIFKVDAEGHESAILRGMDGFVARGVRPIMQLECVPECNGQRRADIYAALAGRFDRDYRYFAVNNDSGTLDEFALGEEIPEWIDNILAVPDERMERLELVMPLVRHMGRI